MSLKNYGWSPAEAAAQSEAQSRESDRTPKFLSFKETNEHVIRILPNPAGGSPFHRFWKHTLIIGDKMRSFACPQRNHGATSYACPICQKVQAAYNSPNKTDKDWATRNRARIRALVNVLVRPTDDEIRLALDMGEPAPIGRVQLWEISSWSGKPNGKNMHEKLLDIYNSKRAGGDFTNPAADGFDIVVTRKGTGIETSYNLFPLVTDRKALLPNEAEAIQLIEHGQIDITPYVTHPSHDMLQQMLQGGAPARSQVASGGERPALRGSVDVSAADYVSSRDYDADDAAGHVDDGF